MPDPIIHAQQSEAELATMTVTTATENPNTNNANGATTPKKHVKRHAMKGRFDAYRRVLLTAWMFDVTPVLWTSLLLPLVFFLTPPPTRAWWLGAAGLWYFTAVLLCTVGRPLDRYLIPALPIMFFTISSAIMLGWNALAGPGKVNGAEPLK